MAISFQYNKTELQRLDKQLKIRTRALPTLKNKESALRLEVKKAKDKVLETENELTEIITQHSDSVNLWNEFMPELLSITEVRTTERKVAGVSIPVLEEILFSEMKFSLFERPKWFPEGLTFLKKVALIVTRLNFGKQKMMLLDHARRKTTQKVNLYEKVQIPGYEDAIRKIKRFLEDEVNLSKSAQKLVKKRQQQQKEMQL
ncbi:V-type ATP synthase subunit D [Maribellus sp. CM-23]|uniref:V-type ATP synthase subunit D n=1 Tax=Maribellus sp. CM-23 TaxID=2781026 RepID=UPI001F4624B5|nr:V-type ATP synthase subunit D [Maribellus sp. CM-23]MCE4565074.1 V-type ATP synthase subunit D [Maribellus sp. CM-23]